MKNKIIIFLIFVNLITFLNSQPFYVHNIIIEGNDITKNEVILNYLTFKIGDLISDEDINYSREKLENSTLFRKVEINQIDHNITKLENSNKKNVVVIKLSEKWYIYPGLLYKYYKNNPKKLSIGFLFTYKNIYGKNHNLKTQFSWLYNNTYLLQYRANNIFYSNYSFETELHYSNHYQKTIEDIESDKMYEYQLSYLQLYQVNNDNKNNLQLHHYISYDYQKYLDLDNNQINKFLTNRIGFTYDNYKSYFYPKNGFELGMSFSNYGLGLSNEINYYSLTGFINKPLLLLNNLNSDLVLKISLTNKVLFGNSLPKQHFLFLGYDNINLRGNYDSFSLKNHINYTGKNFTKLGFYLKDKIYDTGYFDINWFYEGIDKYLKNLRIELYGELFWENIYISNDISNYEKNNYFSSTGVSIYFKIPFSLKLIRADVAIFPNDEISLRNTTFLLAFNVDIR